MDGRSNHGYQQEADTHQSCNTDCIVYVHGLRTSSYGVDETTLSGMDLIHLIENSTLMFGDNKPANILATEDVVSSDNQYVYLSYHYNKEVQELGLSIVHYVRTKDNISDLMTKALKVTEFKTLVNALTGHDVTLINKLIAESWEQIQGSM